MSVMNYEYPNITPSTNDGMQIRNYLYQLVDHLNYSFNNITPVETSQSTSQINYISSSSSSNVNLEGYATEEYVNNSIKDAIDSSWGGSY